MARIKHEPLPEPGRQLSATDEKPFERPVFVKRSGGAVKVASTVEARDMLSSVDWPKRSYRHEDAVDACLKVLDGHRSISDARDAFVEAAREAGILQD